MHLMCPHCQNPIELVTLTASGEVLCAACGSTFRVEPDATITWGGTSRGENLGRFELRSVVGTGAFGTVYRAHDPQLDRTVAVKVPRAGNLPGRQELDRFLREARSTAQLRHPAIVPVYEVGQENGQPYLVSDFVEGVTLDDRLSAGRFPLREAAALVAAVAEALDHAHQHGVIHRDIKPSNIMIRDDGTPAVMDFGLAKRAAGEITMTLDGQVLGTPAYMSPEQARGESHKVDGRSDVYSLGVVLYRLLSGELPFRGNPRMLLHQVLHDEPKSPRSLNDRIPRDLETITVNAMAREPHRRYGTAAAFAADLRHWLAGEPIAARPVGEFEKAWRWTRRHPALVGLMVAAAVAGLAIVAVGFFIAYNGQLQAAYRSEVAARKTAVEHRGLAVKAQAEAQRALETAVEQQGLAVKQRGLAVQAQGEAQRALALANRYLYFLRINQADAAWHDNQPERTSDLLDACPPVERGWEWHYVDQQRHAFLLEFKGHKSAVTLLDHVTRFVADQLLEFKGHASAVTGVAYSPDGRRIASASWDGTVKVWDAATGQEALTLRGHSVAVMGVAYSPDGRRIASASIDRTVKVWDAATGQEALTLRGHTGQVTGVAYSPDGRRLASAGFDDTVKVWDAATGQEALTLRGHTSVVTGVAYSPDGRRIASASWDSTVKVWDVATGQEAFTLRGHTGQVTGVAYSPDGRRLASASYDRMVKVWDAETGQAALTLRGHTDSAFGLGYSPDGRRLASACNDGTVKVWDAATGQEALTLRGHTGQVSGVAYSPDGRRLASASIDGTVKVWDAATVQEALALRGHAGQVSGVAYSPDGRRITSASYDGAVKVWDVAAGREALTFRGHTSAVSGVAYSPDGRRIASASWDRTVKVWDVATGREAVTLRGHTDHVTGVAYSPDGRRIASASWDRTVKVWDAATGQEALTLRGHTDHVTGVAYSPDGRRIASACNDRTVKVWDAATGQEAFTFRGHTGQVFGVAYSPDGRRLASASIDKTVKVWDAETGREALTLRGHTGPVRGMAYGPDGRRLASASDDGTVKLWDVETGQEALTLRGHTGAIESVAYSPDGRRLASASYDGIVKVWDGTPVTPEWQAERRALADRRWEFWLRQEAEDCERQHQWFAAQWHLDCLIAATPGDSALYVRRGRALVELGRWAEADAGFARAAATGTDIMLWFYHALLKLHLGDPEGYRSACAQVLAKYEESERPFDLQWIVIIGDLAPDAVADPARLVRAAERLATLRAAARPATANPEDRWSDFLLGRALYRAGRYQETVKRLQRHASDQNLGDAVYYWLFLALAHQGLGHANEAQTWLGKAESWLDREFAKTSDKGGGSLSWSQRLETRLLLSEARALIREGHPLYLPANVFQADPPPPRPLQSSEK